MATWNEVSGQARRDHTLDHEVDGEFALTIERTDAGKLRKQRVLVRRFISWGREMVEVRSAFGAVGDWDPQALLSDNLNLPLGAVAVHGKYLVLVHKACLEDLSVDGVLFLVRQISLLADILEGRLGIDRF